MLRALRYLWRTMFPDVDGPLECCISLCADPIAFERDALDKRKGYSFCSPKGGINNEPCRARTCDPLIKSQLLYQLS